MHTRVILITILIFFALVVLPSGVMSRTQMQKVDTTTQEDRSLKIFRILNDIGIKFENTKTKVFKFMKLNENTQAKRFCEQFIEDLTVIRDSLKLQVGLTVEDRRFVDRSLARMKKRIEQIIDALPLGS